MEWLTNPNQKCWDKAFQEYALESGLSLKQVSDFIKVNPYVALCIENKAIKLLKQT